MINTIPDIEPALEWAQYQQTLNNQRALLRQRFESQCVLGYAGGLFKVTPEWLAGVDPDSEWVLDHRGLPINIPDVADLIARARETYNCALSDYGRAYQSLVAQRNPNGLTQL
jgi:hypothetical protein